MNNKTLANICGQRWPALQPVTWAAAYCGMALPQFRKSRFAKAIVVIDGAERVYTVELDRLIQEAVEAQIG